MEVIRKKQRIVSSLRDLKLESGQNKVLEQKGPNRANRKNQGFKAQIEDNTIYQKFNKIEKKNTKEDVSFIIKCLNKHFIFCSLMQDVHTIQYLIDHLFYCQIKTGDVIIKQGDNASSFFILHSGKIQVLVNNNPKKELKIGDGFGQLALLYNSQRSASCRAIQNSSLWGIDRHTFRKIVEQINNRLYHQNRKFINDVKFFQNLSTKERDDVSNILIKEKFNKGQIIVNEGDPASSFYIIKTGEVKIVHKGKQMGKLKEGEYFGENGLLAENQVRSMTVVAQKETILLSLGRESLTKVLGKNIQVIVFRNKIRNILSKSPNLSKLSNLHHQKIIDSLIVKKIQQGEILCKQGELCRDKMFFILDGEITKNGEKIDHRGLFFGEQSLQKEKSGLKYNFEIKMNKKGSMAELLFKNLLTIVGGNFEEAVNKSMKTGQLQAKHTNAVQSKRQKYTDSGIGQFLALKKLGFGQFGSVYLVAHKATKQLFALKCISKQQIIQTKLQKHLQQEKKVLEIVNFPLILEYIRSFKDDYFVYFLMDFIRGMQLFDVIRQIGLLQTSDSQFYIGSMILCIEYLHSLGIIYRDLKPQNIMISQKGTLKLIDMGTCKFMKSKGVPKTYTIIGTPHYMAPEVLSGKGYSLNVDLWSIGICLYEFMSGYVPFGEDAQDPYQIYQDIIKKPITFPSYVNDKKAKTLMQQLLSKFPQARLGGSFAALKSHSWFNNFDWDDLLAKKLKPPFMIPQSKMIKMSNIEITIKNAKGIIDQIKSEGGIKKPGNRKDLDPNWDRDY